MKLLVTGATGFLGKRVLELLIDDPQVETIHVPTRRARSHPDPKVQVHPFDLVSPWPAAPFADAFHEIDVVLHLAGLYDFTRGYGNNYQQNVLPTLNLVDWVRSRRNGHTPTILFASTYAVGAGVPGFRGEDPVQTLPSDARPYAHTKAVAERILTDSGLPARIFRFGVLVGDSRLGEIEKVDGPYALMRLLSQISSIPGARFLKRIPVPADPSGVLPLVPVDAAASILHRAALMPQPSTSAEIYGAYRPGSVPIGALTQAIFDELLPGARPFYVDHKAFAERFARLQQLFTRVPTELFRFALEPLELACPRFTRDFGSEAVPAFEEYREAFFRGYSLRGSVAESKIHSGDPHAGS